MFISNNPQENQDAVSVDTGFPHQEKYLYIGETLFFKQFFRLYFSNTILAKSFYDAKKELAGTAALPELIIIDLPLNYFELVAFKVWVHNTKYHKIPVIYSQSAINTFEVKQLFRQKLVDDVVNLEANYCKLSSKRKFIQKFKSKNARTLNESLRRNKGQFEASACDFCIWKKLLDITLSLMAIIICLPLFFLIALAIKLESKGPVFYCSKRAGKGFRVFNFFKFRTMILDADKKIKELEYMNQYENNGKLPSFFKLQDDPRVTKVGAFLRNTSLDELPQFFNVLVGDMSIVGNRPLPLYEAYTLTTDDWAERFMAPAGITGLWQVLKRGKENMSNEERVALDINYARTRSLKGDIKILLNTPAALFQKTNV